MLQVFEDLGRLLSHVQGGIVPDGMTGVSEHRGQDAGR
jgi:hypothetical protein